MRKELNKCFENLVVSKYLKFVFIFAFGDN